MPEWREVKEYHPYHQDEYKSYSEDLKLHLYRSYCGLEKIKNLPESYFKALESSFTELLRPYYEKVDLVGGITVEGFKLVAQADHLRNKFLRGKMPKRLTLDLVDMYAKNDAIVESCSERRSLKDLIEKYSDSDTSVKIIVTTPISKKKCKFLNDLQDHAKYKNAEERNIAILRFDEFTDLLSSTGMPAPTGIKDRIEILEKELVMCVGCNQCPLLQ